MELASSDQIAIFDEQSKKELDLKIRIDDYEWQVHSEIVAKQSKFFERICNGGFKEEAERVVELHDDCPWIVATMIMWSYRESNSDLEFILFGEGNKRLAMMMNQGAQRSDSETIKTTYAETKEEIVYTLVYQISDKYEIEELTNQVRKELTCNLQKRPDSTMKHLVQSLDLVVIENDEELCEHMLMCEWRRAQTCMDVYHSWQSLFKNEPSMMDKLLRFICQRLDANHHNIDTAVRDIGLTKTNLADIEQVLMSEGDREYNEPVRLRIRTSIERLEEVTRMLDDGFYYY